MKTFPPLRTDFTIIIFWKQRPLQMQVRLAYVGESVERWELRFADRLFYFQNDRPALQVGGINRAVHWKMVKGIEYLIDKNKPEDAVLLLTDIWEAIEKTSVGKKDPTFQEVRNKQ